MSSSMAYKFAKEDAFVEDDDYQLQLASIQDTLRTIKDMEQSPDKSQSHNISRDRSRDVSRDKSQK